MMALDPKFTLMALRAITIIVMAVGIWQILVIMGGVIKERGWK